MNFNLYENELKESTIEKRFCEEKEILIINDTGKLCIDFLKKYFGNIFDYSYTKRMEEELDKIKENSCNWSDICKETMNDIDKLSKLVKKENDVVLDDNHTLKFSKFGPCIKHTIDEHGNYEYLPVKSDLSLEQLTNTPMKDLLEFENSLLGKYNNIPLYLKMGKFGPYLQYDAKNFSIRNKKSELNSITLENAIEIIESCKTTPGG